LGIGITCSLYISKYTGVWQDYIGAILMPVIGLSLSYISSPENKIKCVTFTLLFGLYFLFFHFTPSDYPENHPTLAYQPTYIPPIMAFVTAIIFYTAIVQLHRTITKASK
jgi:putative Mn2+ efflux pump MntP